MSQSYLDGRVVVHAGDCLEILKTIEENSVDSVVTDSPYHLTSIVKRFGGKNAAPNKFGKDGSFKRLTGGFMNKTWDGGDIAFRPELWAEVLRVLKPGGHVLVFGGTRTQHRMVCAIEDAGFEIRDQLMWIFGSGFPKSLDIGKAIDRAAGVWRGRHGVVTIAEQSSKGTEYERTEKGPAVTDAAKQWDGWGTALKPAFENICLARKPLSEKTVAANILKWGTGGLNIAACKVPAGDDQVQLAAGCVGFGSGRDDSYKYGTGRKYGAGRWPANLLHDGSEEVLACFPESNVSGSAKNGTCSTISSEGMFGKRTSSVGPNDSGSAARFFYCAKAGPEDRLGSKHPTVKPLKLLQYLCRLITPPGGTILDCFAGTGTTAEAAYREGFNAVLIEREDEYLADIERRMNLVTASKQERKQASDKARVKAEDAGPLFEAAE